LEGGEEKQSPDPHVVLSQNVPSHKCVFIQHLTPPFAYQTELKTLGHIWPFRDELPLHIKLESRHILVQVIASAEVMRMLIPLAVVSIEPRPAVLAAAEAGARHGQELTVLLSEPLTRRTEVGPAGMVVVSGSLLYQPLTLQQSLTRVGGRQLRRKSSNLIRSFVRCRLRNMIIMTLVNITEQLL
jgi:hypothetical protein